MKITDLLKQLAKIVAIVGAVLAALNHAIGERSE
jgi:hypothetical protein